MWGPAEPCWLHGPFTRYVLRMCWECREHFHRHRLQRKPLVGDPDMHHGTCVTHVPWCMSGSLTRDDGENVPGIPGACATRNFAYLARGPWGPQVGSRILTILGITQQTKTAVTSVVSLYFIHWFTVSISISRWRHNMEIEIYCILSEGGNPLK